MKRIEITGNNYEGSWTKTRTACRGILIKNNQILLTCDTKTDLWMIPGGGMKNGESDFDCCIREIGEETGILIRPLECKVELIEYYTHWKWVNRYFTTEIIGSTKQNLTQAETEAGMKAIWVDLDQAVELFANYEKYTETFLMKRNIAFREYTALKEFL